MTTAAAALIPGTDLVIGARVRVHYNLIKGGYSITVTTNGRDKVVANVPEVYLRNVTFRVMPGMLARVRANRRRKVYAYAVGELAPVPDMTPARKVTINPYRADTFVYADTGERIDTAAAVYFSGAYAWV